MSKEVLQSHRGVWHCKPAIRAIYADFYHRIIAAASPGNFLEIGSGSGNLRDFSDDVVSTDIVFVPWLNAVADAQRLPFRDHCFSNLVMVDVLHHIENPLHFLREARRVLRPGGRLIMVEPGITPVSRIFFRLFHPEPVLLDVDPYAERPPDPDRQPFDANQAIPTLMFFRNPERLSAYCPGLRLVQAQRFSLFAYPLSGGFRPWCLIPAAAIDGLLRFEARWSPSLGALMGFRVFVVLERLP